MRSVRVIPARETQPESRSQRGDPIVFSIQGPSLCKTSTENFKIENASAVEPAEMAEAVSVDEHFGRDVTTITFKNIACVYTAIAFLSTR